MHHYKVCGLTIASQIMLPELDVTKPSPAADITFEIGELGLIKDAPTTHFEFSDVKQVLVYPRVAAFQVTDGRKVIIEPAPDADSNLVSLPLLGPVLGLLLHSKQLFVLHASAVGIDQKAYGFLGHKGAGKSTLAANLLLDRHTKLLTDDLLALDSKMRVLPSFSQMNLLPDSLNSVRAIDGEARPPALENLPKSQLKLRSSPSSPILLKAIFEIRRDREAGLEDLSFPEALKVILTHTYIARFASRRPSLEERRWIFQRATQIANSCSVKRLFVPDDLERIDDVRKFLISS